MSFQTVMRKAVVKKAKLAEEIAGLLNRYGVIAVFDLTGVRSNTIHEMRKKLRGLCEIRVLKKTLFLKACRLAGKTELEKLVEDVTAPAGFIFSSINSFKLATMLEKSKVPMYAKAGEKADFDVWVPETNTGLPPGPILSDFGKLRIPTRIEGGQVWIARDTLVAKKGEEISQLLASLLVKLDIKAVLRGVTILRSFEDNMVLRGSDLIVDLNKTRAELLDVVATALAFAVNIGYFTRDTLPLLLVKAGREAAAVAVETGYYTKEVLPLVIARALSESAALSAAIEKA
ncbi:MAG: 50S ribosomal protein L10 [Candidatus Caldarchaeum sp.]|uniref:Large ribosomal subunit protein uL10 n=1 Tax=Caldiarchaeum subterraneum TaxID=311458 RepID=A0A7C5LBA3_CALS0